MNKLLIIDDDVELCELLTHWLTQEGFEVEACHSTQVGKNLLTNETLPDAVILDVMLPDGNGLELLKLLRTQHSELPVLMLSARGEPLDRILGLELGADDYLPKPCDPRELTARLKAILRRAHPAHLPPNHLEVGDLSYSPIRGVVTIGDVEINLTVSESRLLEALLKQPGDPIEKQTLSQLALGKPLTLYDRSLDMHISNLRKKLGPHADGSARILSLRSRGYYYVA